MDLAKGPSGSRYHLIVIISALSIPMIWPIFILFLFYLLFLLQMGNIRLQRRNLFPISQAGHGKENKDNIGMGKRRMRNWCWGRWVWWSGMECEALGRHRGKHLRRMTQIRIVDFQDFITLANPHETKNCHSQGV